MGDVRGFVLILFSEADVRVHRRRQEFLGERDLACNHLIVELYARF